MCQFRRPSPQSSLHLCRSPAGRTRLCMAMLHIFFFFFFQAEDGIRDLIVTGVQTCALPISVSSQLGANAGLYSFAPSWELTGEQWDETVNVDLKGVWITCKVCIPQMLKIGRASCRERV